MKATFDLAAMIGWQTERFARTKIMKPLGKYLEPAMSSEKKREQGARAVLAMFKRHAAKTKGARDGSR